MAAKPKSGEKKPTKRSASKRGRQAAFLKGLCQFPNITKAAQLAKCDRSQVYRWRESDPGFAEAMDEAFEQGIANLEAEADRRAYIGVTEPVYQGGHYVGDKQRYSDTLLIFRLKALRPDVYRDNVSIDQTTRIDGPVFVREPEAPARAPEHETSDALNRLRRTTTSTGNVNGHNGNGSGH